jgi:glycosyltransferase involved in cell wall biosynthesis
MEVNAPMVSVLVTVFNREAYLEATLRSILVSTFNDIEIIVVDDCSQDRSIEVATAVGKNDSRIKIHVNEQNLGDYGNRMKAASLATGRYLKYVDSDDLIYSHSLQVMVDTIEQNNSIALALSHSLPEDEQPYPWVLSPNASYRKHFLGRGCLACGPSGAIIRRSAFEQVGGFRKEWGVVSDIDLWLQLAARWPVALLPPGLVWWRRHEGQEFCSRNASLIYLERGFDLAMQSLENAGCPLSIEECNNSKSRIRQHHARRLFSLATHGRSPGFAWKLFQKSGLTLRQLASGLSRYR